MKYVFDAPNRGLKTGAQLKDDKKKLLRDFIHNGDPIPSELRNKDNGFLLTKIAGDYLDNDDVIRATIALTESKKCHSIGEDPRWV